MLALLAIESSHMPPPIFLLRTTDLVSPARLKELMRSLAMLDALMEPEEWDARWFSYDPVWDEGVSVGSMRDGSGDWFAVRFSGEGDAVVRGFAHESQMSPFRSGGDGRAWPGLFEGLPERYAWAREADGFVGEEVTFCAWYDEGWTVGPVQFPSHADPDGSERLLALLDDEPSTYVRFAKDIYERELDVRSVAALYRSTPLDEKLLASLAPGVSAMVATRLAKELGYPQYTKQGA